jgi:hypothetical protein
MDSRSVRFWKGNALMRELEGARPAPSSPKAAPEGLAKELHDAVMRMPCHDAGRDPCADSSLNYKLGHRDARHAIAEMLLTHPKLRAPAGESTIPR